MNTSLDLILQYCVINVNKKLQNIAKNMLVIAQYQRRKEELRLPVIKIENLEAEMKRNKINMEMEKRIYFSICSNGTFGCFKRKRNFLFIS